MNRNRKACYDCGNELLLGAKYCSNCGRHIRKRFERFEEQAKRKEPRIAEHTISNYSREAWNNYCTAILHQAKERNRKVLRFFSIFFLVAILSAFLDIEPLAFVSIVIALLSLFFLMNPNRWLSKEEYYSFLGSRFENGQHRCIFCGAKGIFRQGQYKTNNTYTKCSKCEMPLFKE